MRNRGWLVTIASALLIACGSSSPPTMEAADVRLGQPTGPHAALYFTLHSDRPDRLIGASTAVAESVELHETTMEANGTMSMNQVDGFDIGDDGGLVLAPGGRHLMLVGVERLEVGDTVEVTLDFETAEDVVVSAPVVAPQDVLMEGEPGT